jgi:cell division control protein 7
MTAIDVWSAGVILLSILTHKFPVFNSNDDTEALLEIAVIFGRSAMERCAILHSEYLLPRGVTRQG